MTNSNKKAVDEIMNGVREAFAEHYEEEKKKCEEERKMTKWIDSEGTVFTNYDEFLKFGADGPYDVEEVDVESRIQALRKRTGLSAQKFGDLYGIPLRTVQNWEYGTNECPEYVLRLLERAVMEDARKKKPFRERTMTELFRTTGCEEVFAMSSTKKVHDMHYHEEDFTKGGKMERFANYKVARFEEEFACCVFVG